MNEWLIMYRSPSLGIAGWSHPDLVVLDDDEIDKERRDRERLREPGARWTFGVQTEDERKSEKHSVQVVKFISALGESGAGRRAVLKDVADRRGIDDPDDLEKLFGGKSDVDLKIPTDLRAAMQGIGLGDALAPINVTILKDPD